MERDCLRTPARETGRGGCLLNGFGIAAIATSEGTAGAGGGGEEVEGAGGGVVGEGEVDEVWFFSLPLGVFRSPIERPPIVFSKESVLAEP